MPSLQDIVMRVVDGFIDIVPRSTPDPEALRRCKIISHRGEHDNRDVLENTIEAFSNAVDAGVWGIECDIRFTRDGVPVICHDPCGTRVFGMRSQVSELTFSTLRQTEPRIPTLEEVVSRFGVTTHLMLEIKNERWPEPAAARDTLQSILSGLKPIENYHVLALHPELFQRVDFVPPAACLPVAEINVRRLSNIALENGHAGLGGHYVLLSRKYFERHRSQGQRLGVGFPRSRNALFRELNRGIEWVFSNDAVHLQRILNEHRDQA